MRLLVVEDFTPLRDALARGLREQGYAVDAVDNGRDAVDYIESAAYDLVVLDLMLPGKSGFDVLREARADGCESRVLILTARDGVRDRVKGLDLGADDYLVKPFVLDEFMARVRALLRRQYTRASPTVEIGALRIDTASRSVQVKGTPIDLTAREYSVLEVLALRAGQTVTRDEIWERIYDFSAERGSNVVDVYVGYLRRKLERDGAPRVIHTRRGLGYVLEAR